MTEQVRSLDIRARIRELMPHLPPERQAQYRDQLRRLYGSESLSDYIMRVSPHHPPPRHITPLIDLIERARWGPVRACVSMPPRHAKTITILHGLAWWTQLNPADTSGYISYSDHQALSKSRICRALAAMGGLEQGETDSASEWSTPQGGGLLAAGAMAGITGRGLHGLIVVDDPYKNRREVDSDVVRETVWENFKEVVLTRSEGASVIVCHTRWRPDDLIGRLVEEMGWEYLNLPALAEENDPLGRAVGEALWKGNRLYDEAALDLLRRTLGDWSFSALYQGRPRPRGASVFGMEHYGVPPVMEDDEPERMVIYADPAASKKEHNNEGAMLVMAAKGEAPHMRCRVVDVEHGHWTVPEFVRKLRAFIAKHGNLETWVEAVGGFKAVPQLLEEINEQLVEQSEVEMVIHEDIPEGDKFQRAQAVAAAWNDDPARVTVPYGAPWVPALVAEVKKFTGVNDPADNMVDCLSGAYNVLAKHKPTHFHRTSGLYKPRR